MAQLATPYFYYDYNSDYSYYYDEKTYGFISFSYDDISYVK